MGGYALNAASTLTIVAAAAFTNEKADERGMARGIGFGGFI